MLAFRRRVRDVDSGVASSGATESTAYAADDFDIRLSLDAIATAVESETETIEYVVETYGEGVVDEIIDVWDRVEAGELTYREASATIDMAHADFLRLAAELELLDR